MQLMTKPLLPGQRDKKQSMVENDALFFNSISTKSISEKVRKIICGVTKQKNAAL